MELVLWLTLWSPVFIRRRQLWCHVAKVFWQPNIIMLHHMWLWTCFSKSKNKYKVFTPPGSCDMLHFSHTGEVVVSSRKCDAPLARKELEMFHYKCITAFWCSTTCSWCPFYFAADVNGNLFSKPKNTTEKKPLNSSIQLGCHNLSL